MYYRSTKSAPKVQIADWISWYNHRRPHQALKMKTLAEAYALAA
nr:integrase core domain-containing protein [Curvibacter gracilis]